MLRIANAGFKYQAENGEVEVFDDISFSVDRGCFLSIVGPSGCGKSTLLSLVAGLLPMSKGEITINGEKLCGISPHIGYMLQRDNLLEWRTIWKNVLFGLEIQGKINDNTIQRTENLLKKYDLFEFRNKYPRQLSGGMRQRVALIRTLATSPDILLLDEAFSALDYQTRLDVTNDVYQIIKTEGVTTLMVTHDIPESICMGDRVMILTKRPAKIKEIVEIDFPKDRTPITCRTDMGFSLIFDHIWKELKSCENE